MDPAWDEYRRRRRAFWLAIPLAIVWFVLGSLVCDVLVRYGFNGTLTWFLIAALPAQGYLMVSALRRSLWPCPRCGRPFHCTWLYGNWFVRRCVHCGLPKWTPVPAPTDSVSASP